jgi:hypothetical protein
MLSRRALVAGLTAIAFAGEAIAAEQSAKDFVASIYAAYKGKGSKGITLDTRAKVARYFTPSLAKLINDDSAAAKKRQEVGALDGDPFIDAQDWEISDVAVDVKEEGTKAVATVKFKNFTDDKTVVLDLVKLKQGWRIDEIKMPSGSLRDLFKKK